MGTYGFHWKSYSIFNKMNNPLMAKYELQFPSNKYILRLKEPPWICIEHCIEMFILGMI